MSGPRAAVALILPEESSSCAEQLDALADVAARRGLEVTAAAHDVPAALELVAAGRAAIVLAVRRDVVAGSSGARVRVVTPVPLHRAVSIVRPGRR
ncbi:hypothetical protein ABT369_05350 [Dactylosporangium sp. NPDC000244]|uniref:hypothetical protein n=1 Tax=Dactylosporangium sp. NPDC000244 TaxID=3154365 RepID=UPI0033252E3D